jgi:hypothetical protein
VGADTGGVQGAYFFTNNSGEVAGFGNSESFDFLNFVSGHVFGSYDGLSSIGPLSVTPTQGQVVRTGFGFVNFAGATNLVFEAVLAKGATVPEPSTWAAMLLGFSLVALALRRRRVALESLS